MRTNVMRGFTLIEILITLVIVSVGMLALGKFFAAAINQEGAAQERIAAVHMAEQLLEEWQQANTPPTPDCTVNGVAAGALVVGTAIIGCRANNGVPVGFDILLSTTPATAPLPPLHPNNGGAGVVTAGLLQGVDPYTQAVIAGSAPVMVRTVSVSWVHGGEIKNIYLTHITRFWQ